MPLPCTGILLRLNNSANLCLQRQFREYITAVQKHHFWKLYGVVVGHFMQFVHFLVTSEQVVNEG